MEAIRYLTKNKATGQVVIRTMGGQEYEFQPSRLSFQRTSSGDTVLMFDPDNCSLVSGSEEADTAWTDFLARNAFICGAVIASEVMEDPVVEQTFLDCIEEQKRLQGHRHPLSRESQQAVAVS